MITAANRKYWIIGSLAAIAGGVGLIIVNKRKKEKEVAEIMLLLNSEIGQNEGGSRLGNQYNLWDPRYYQVAFKNGATIFQSKTAKNYAKQIYDANGWFTENEGAVFAAFRSIGSKARISQVSFEFSSIYGTDLYTYLTDTLLNPKEMDQLARLIATFKD
ncbi:MAG: hypothetical protein EXR21_10395 [Flavobacteriaceae bacterium]|nr:hypothetical protein [Flavobacteriaceae bacterium]